MPLPIAHSIAGYLYSQTKPVIFFDKSWKDLLFLVFISNLPDIDFLPGFLIGTPSKYHSLYTHTLGASVIIGLISAFYFSRKHKKFIFYFIFTSLVYYSHIILDCFTEDYRAPFGNKLFWPLSNEHFISKFSFFLKVDRSHKSIDFFPSLFQKTNLDAFFREILIMGTLALVILIIKNVLNKKK